MEKERKETMKVINDDDDHKLEEDVCRNATVRLMLEAGERLRLPQETIATSIVIFHRFFDERRLIKYSRAGRLQVLVTTCVFLAAKVEEQPRRLRDVINSIYYISTIEKLRETAAADNDDASDVMETNAVLKLDREYWDLKEKVVDTEQLILRVLAFDVDTFQPYRLLLNYARSLRCRRVLVKVAWTMINDSLFSSLCCSKMPPQAQAVGALYLAQVSLREKEEDGEGGEEEAGRRRMSSSKSNSSGNGGGVGGDGALKEMRLTPELWQVLGAKKKDVEEYCQEMLRLYEDGVILKMPSSTGGGGEAAAAGGGGSGSGGGTRPP